MKFLTMQTLTGLLLFGLISSALGQNAPAPSDSKESRYSQPRGNFPMPKFVLKEALDTNKDGKLSADEIKAAPESLKKLDKNQDGKINAEEIGWPPRMQGFPGRGGGRPPFGGGGQTERSLAELIMRCDANGDGKVSKDELPKSMFILIQMADTDKDGAIDKKEAEQLAQKLGLDAASPAQKNEK
jgi:Ca2+-binding EF-hand superfamily protein